VPEAHSELPAVAIEKSAGLIVEPVPAVLVHP
jgi:hypothetical protein